MENLIEYEGNQYRWLKENELTKDGDKICIGESGFVTIGSWEVGKNPNKYTFYIRRVYINDNVVYDTPEEYYHSLKDKKPLHSISFPPSDLDEYYRAYIKDIDATQIVTGLVIRRNPHLFKTWEPLKGYYQFKK
jgi:hypothetical protein